MFKTEVTKRLGIEYPIIGGTMMHLSTPEYVAAISEAGCLGMLCSAMYTNKEQFRVAVNITKSLTKKPFGVNLNLFPAMSAIDNNEYLDIIDEAGIAVVESSGHKAPEELVPRLKNNNKTWIHKCVGLRYAQKAVSLGADMITVVGYENGGATGVMDIGASVLVARTAEELKVPVIGGGGVSNGRGLMAMLALGAEGVIIGTRFLLSEECPIHANLKNSLLNADETQTVLVMRTIGNTHRIWKNSVADRVAELETKHASLEEIIKEASGIKDKEMYASGNVEKGTISLGQGIGLVHDIKPVKQIVADIMREAKETADKIAELVK